MASSHASVNQKFRTLIEESFAEYKKIYDTGLTRNPDRNETSRRREGKNACMQLAESRRRINGDPNSDSIPVLFCMVRRYRAFVEQHYDLSEDRFSEWWSEDWKQYLLSEFHVGDKAKNSKVVSKETITVSRWSRKKVMTFLAQECALNRLLREHEDSLQPATTVQTEMEPEAYVAENNGSRRAESFDSWQCTAVFVALIDAITRHERHLDQDSEDRAHYNDIYNLNLSKFAELISLVSGLNQDNIRKNLYAWRNDNAKEHGMKLRIVRDALLAFNVEIDVSILEEAIKRTGQ